MNDMTAPRPGAIDVGGKPYMADAKGALVPVELVKPVDLLIDETVRKIMGFARDLSAQVARFRGHTFDDVNSLQALISQEYGASVGGSKGNISLTSYDGCQRVQVQVADLLEFGPELQAAKRLVDACLVEWGAESRPEIRGLVNRVFSVEKDGAINRAELFTLLRLEIDDPRWIEAMRAIRESIRVIGSRQYVRFYQRARPTDPWRAVSIDIASVGGGA